MPTDNTSELLDTTLSLGRHNPLLQPETRIYLQNQGLIYTGYLVDVAKGKVKANPENHSAMTDLITEFCNMIQSELNTAKGAKA